DTVFLFFYYFQFSNNIVHLYLNSFFSFPFNFRFFPTFIVANRVDTAFKNKNSPYKTTTINAIKLIVKNVLIALPPTYVLFYDVTAKFSISFVIFGTTSNKSPTIP